LRRCARTRAAVHGRPLRRLSQDCPERIAPCLLADSSLCMAGQNGDSSLLFPGDSPVATLRETRQQYGETIQESAREQNVRRIPPSNTATLRIVAQSQFAFDPGVAELDHALRRRYCFWASGVAIFWAQSGESGKSMRSSSGHPNDVFLRRDSGS
jgi:hypothetical protein